MTTKVTVTNHGPSPVQVKIMDRKPCVNTTDVRVPDDRPRFIRMESKYRGNALLPGASENYYVHGRQELAIVELMPNALDETPL